MGRFVIIGICGKYCSGKDEVVSVLLQQGMEHINVDALGHRALEEEQENIIQCFGQDIRSEQGIDRGKLASIVFSNEPALRRLESIVHPRMKELVQQQIQESANEHILINAALLFPMGLDTLCQKILLLQCPLIRRIYQARKRDNAGLRRICQILWVQRGIIPKFSLEKPDIYTVHNNRSQKELMKNVSHWWLQQANKVN